jgi:hypothetical protein
MEAEVRVMPVHSREAKGLQHQPEVWREAWTRFSLGALRKYECYQLLTLAFRSPEL